MINWEPLEVPKICCVVCYAELIPYLGFIGNEVKGWDCPKGCDQSKPLEPSHTKPLEVIHTVFGDINIVSKVGKDSSDFQVGDVVECIDDDYVVSDFTAHGKHEYITKGKTYTISEIKDNFVILVRNDKNDSPISFFKTRFKKV
jgi:hypothetical protein